MLLLPYSGAVNNRTYADIQNVRTKWHALG